MPEHGKKPQKKKTDFWKKALIVAQIAGGLATVGAFGVGLIMLGNGALTSKTFKVVGEDLKENATKFGDVLHAVCAELRLTQFELATLTEYSEAAISRAGKWQPLSVTKNGRKIRRKDRWKRRRVGCWCTSKQKTKAVNFQSPISEIFYWEMRCPKICPVPEYAECDGKILSIYLGVLMAP